MVKRGFLFIITVLFAFPLFSQKIQKVSAKYTYYAPETMSIEEAKRTALKYAQIQAIADEFGSIVTQSTSLMSSDKNGQFDEKFFSLAETDVKGEWIETIGEPVYDIQFGDHVIAVTCDIKGKAREITQAKVEFIAKPLRNGTSLKYESTEFRDGDDLYLYFQSPVDGFLSVYLLDEMAQTVYSILPYKSDNIATVPIVANSEYIFFSVRDAEKIDRGKVDEYKLSCNLEKEYNTMYILFSPSQFGKRNGFDSDIEDVPDNISYENFKQWLVKILTKDKKIQTNQIKITISK
ncbi:MAG: DUF4384 domain-containing protein [Muribaculaceae bacterium]|nr:DUF4384 domain-containing protein [Muribaculaceae bacterium]